MRICDRCQRESKELIELKEDVGGGEVCKVCIDEINAAFWKFTDQNITPLYDKRREYVKMVTKGFKLVD